MSNTPKIHKCYVSDMDGTKQKAITSINDLMNIDLEKKKNNYVETKKAIIKSDKQIKNSNK